MKHTKKHVLDIQLSGKREIENMSEHWSEKEIILQKEGKFAEP